MNENVLSAYCFLAALTENQNDLFNHVYVPICKRTISLHCRSGATSGKCSDIKDLILKEYGIDVPILATKKLINAAFKSLSNNAKKKYGFQIFENGSTFQVEKYTFEDLESSYEKGLRDSKALEEAFYAYLSSEHILPNSLPPFSDFIDKNKKQLVSFFNYTAIDGKTIDGSFFYHVEFLKKIELSNHGLFEVAKDLYLGSIVAGFLEAGIDLEPKFVSGEIYFLDTQIVLRALDLQYEDETLPIKELLQLIQSTGGNLKVLSVTTEEIHSVIGNAIDNYSATEPTTTINEACSRLNKSKAWLISFNAKLEQHLQELGIKKEMVLDSFVEKVLTNKDVKSLQQMRVRKSNALHDVVSYMYVRQMRSKSVNTFQKAKVWFLSSNDGLRKFNNGHITSSKIGEIITPDTLTDLLWLKNPSKLVGNVRKIGLSELLAATLRNELPSRELINEYDTNIKSIEGLSDEDYTILLESVAHQSAKRIEKFNELIVTDKAKAVTEAYKIIEGERTRKAVTTTEIKDLKKEKEDAVTNSTELATKLDSIEEQLKQSNATQEQTNAQLAKLANENKLFKRLLTWGGVIVVCLLVIFNIDKIIEIPKWLKLIPSLGGLWGFFSFILNIVRFFKK